MGIHNGDAQIHKSSIFFALSLWRQAGGIQLVLWHGFNVWLVMKLRLTYPFLHPEYEVIQHEGCWVEVLCCVIDWINYVFPTTILIFT